MSRLNLIVINASLKNKIFNYVEKCVKDIFFNNPINPEDEIKEDIIKFLKSLKVEDIDVLVLWGLGNNVDIFKVFIGFTKNEEKKVLKIRIEI